MTTDTIITTGAIIANSACCLLARIRLSGPASSLARRSSAPVRSLARSSSLACVRPRSSRWLALARFGNFVARAQAARADIDILHGAVDEQALMLNIHDKASVGMTF